MIGTDELSLLSTIRALRHGPITNDYTAPQVADLIERLMVERAANTKHIQALEAFVTPRTGASSRNIFAEGFRACQEMVLRELPLMDLENEIRALRPSLMEANRIAAENVERMQ